MVVPSDLPALFSLRTKHAIATIEAEHPASTRVELVTAQARRASRSIARRFSQLGENMLKVRYGSDQWMSLEFFVTEPLETVIQKRAAFLVSHHQHTDPSKWYVGVYGDWDQKNEILRGPEDRDNLSAWLTDANDDAGNARPAFIAAKNVFFPNQAEIDSLELYIEQVPLGRDADDGAGEVSLRHLRHPELAGQPRPARTKDATARRTSGGSTTTRTSCISTTGCTRSRSSTRRE